MEQYCMKCMYPVEGEEDCPHCGYHPGRESAAHVLAPGTVLLDRYLIGEVIGQGGFGITYIGRDLRLNMRIAVKEYYPNGYANRNVEASDSITITDEKQRSFIEDGKSRFLREARALARFHGDPGVVDVRDYFEANNTAYIIMEYLEGEDLRRRIKKKLFSADEIFALMEPIFGTLGKIHKEDIIHRDISPDNIMLLKNGTLKLMDFGAARLVNFSDQRSISVVLKSGYAPEEQYRPRGIQGPWTDIYALCSTIYKCITGITLDDALERGFEDNTKWPSELDIPISAAQEAVLRKGLSIRAKDRFQSLEELVLVLHGESAEDIHGGEITIPQGDKPTVADPEPAGAAGEDVTVSEADEPETVYEGGAPAEPEAPDIPGGAASERTVTETGGWTSPERTGAAEKRKSQKDAEVEKQGEKQTGADHPTQGDQKKRKRTMLFIGGAALLVLLIVIGIIAFGGGKTSSTNTESEIVMAPSMLWGEYTASHSGGMEYQNLPFGDDIYEVSVLPCALSVDPTENENLIRVTFEDRFGETYEAEGEYSLSPDGLLTIGIDGSGSGEWSDVLEYQVSLFYGRVMLSYGGLSCTLVNAGEKSLGTVVLQGALSSDQPIEELQYISARCSVSGSGGESFSAGLIDGGYVVNGKVSSLYSNIQMIDLKWQEECRPYNGREEVFSVSKYFDARYINTYPYGFILIVDNVMYFYQDPVDETLIPQEEPELGELTPDEANEFAVTCIEEYAAESFSPTEHLGGIELLGTYLFAEEGDEAEPSVPGGYLYSVEVNWDDLDDGTTFYWVQEYDFVLDDQGEPAYVNGAAGYQNATTRDDVFYIPTYQYYYHGYPTLAEVYRKWIAPKEDSFTLLSETGDIVEKAEEDREHALIYWDTQPLEAAVREVLDIPEGDIYSDDLAGITELNLVGRDLSRIEALAWFTDLTFLELDGNQISDITPLAELTDLQRLRLSGNEIVDISPLAGLEQLRELELDYNQIEDITALTELDALEILWIDGNSISSIEPLRGHTNLHNLYMDNNPVQDISSLFELSGLEVVYLDGRYISDADIDALRERLPDADIQTFTPDYYVNPVIGEVVFDN